MRRKNGIIQIFMGRRGHRPLHRLVEPAYVGAGVIDSPKKTAVALTAKQTWFTDLCITGMIIPITAPARNHTAVLYLIAH